MILPDTQTAKWAPDERRRQLYRAFFVILGLSMLLLKSSIRDVLKRPPPAALSGITQEVSGIVRAKLPHFMQKTVGRYGMIVVVDPRDLGCPPCFEDLQRISDDLRQLASAEHTRRGVYLMRQNPTGPWNDSASVRQWAEAQELPFSILMIPDTTYASWGFSKTSVIAVDESLKAVLVEAIPLTKERRSQFHLLMEERRNVDNP
jgi:hypothetical protein